MIRTIQLIKSTDLHWQNLCIDFIQYYKILFLIICKYNLFLNAMLTTGVYNIHLLRH